MKKLLTCILLSASVSSYGQSGQWTWMKGDSLPGQSANYGTQGISSPTNKPGYTYEGTEWKDLSGNFWMYDNYDLWKFNPSTIEWTWMKGTQNVITPPSYGAQGIPSATNHPGFRYHGAASWVDNNGDLWLFGSQGTGGFKNDLWKYNIASNEWTWMKGDSTISQAPTFGIKGIASTTTNPGGMYETNASWTDSNNNLWLFGGWGYNYTVAYGEWNTLWKYDPTINQWTWISGDSVINAPAVYGIKGVANPNNKPSARFAYSKWIINDDLWLFGGATAGGSYKLNDLWKYSITTNEWTWVSGTDTINDRGVYIEKCVPCSECYPASRNESRSSWRDFNGNLWLYGGQNTLHRNNYFTLGNSYPYVFIDSVKIDTVVISGNNVVWDFSNTVLTTKLDTLHAIDPATTIFYNAPNVNYTISNLCLVEPTGRIPYEDSLYSYCISDSSSIYFVGNWANNGIWETWYYHLTDTEKYFAFPFSLNDSFMDSLSGVFLDMSTGEWHTLQGTRNVEADGFGTLIMPSATYPDCLRIKSTLDALDSTASGTYHYIWTFYDWFQLNTNGKILEIEAHGNYIWWHSKYYYNNPLITVNELSFENSIAVFPNPFTSQISITVKKENVKEKIFIVRNTLGQVVYTAQGKKLNSIDLGFLSKGLYLLDVIIDGERTVRKIVKE